MLFSRRSLKQIGQVKNRPAIILREMPPFRDLLVCGVSTQLQQYVEGFDEYITHAEKDFAGSGLMADSIIRLGFLAVLPRRVILGTIGAIARERHERLLWRLAKHLTGT